jgi:hypothetical protein
VIKASLLRSWGGVGSSKFPKLYFFRVGGGVGVFGFRFGVIVGEVQAPEVHRSAL